MRQPQRTRAPSHCLIAAAPDLLYVARRVVQDWDHSQNADRGTDLLKQARAAIAKAEGVGGKPA